jgi:hypothetical protein
MKKIKLNKNTVKTIKVQSKIKTGTGVGNTRDCPSLGDDPDTKTGTMFCPTLGGGPD